MRYYYYVVSAEQRRHFSKEDYKIFLAKLEESLYLNNTKLHAFTFLPPRFYLLLETKEAKIDRFMQHLNVSWAMALKLTRDHKGPLFSGRYLAYPFTNKNLLLPLSQSIHLLHLGENPGWGLNYPFSSLSGYLEKKQAQRFVNYETLLAETGGRLGYKKRLKEKAGKINPQEALANFINTFNKTKPNLWEKGKRKRLKPEVVFATVTQTFGLKEEEIKKRNRNGKVKGVLAEFLLKFCQLTQNEIGQILGGIGYSAISHLRYRMREKLKSDKKLAETFQDIEKKLINLMR